MTHEFAVALIAALALSACGGRTSQPTTPTSREVVDIEEMHIIARTGEDGYEFESVDADSLFREGVRLAQQGDCEGAVERYDRVVSDFPSSSLISHALYNAGLCLQQNANFPEAARRFETLLADLPESEDVKHASFQLAAVYVAQDRWDETLALATRIAERNDLTNDERVEAMARQAQALYGEERFDEASERAQSALSFARTRPEDEPVRDEYFLGAANYVHAETIRLQAEAIEVPVGRVEEQRAVLEGRAQLILRAQRAYFDTIRHRDPHWAAAAGYHIGQMYESFWNAIMNAPVPPPRIHITEANMPIYEEEYRNELALLVKPLVRHSIRYWELTLMMVERTGIETEWTRRIHQDLETARARLLAQPEGTGGLPSSEEEVAPPEPRYPRDPTEPAPEATTSSSDSDSSPNSDSPPTDGEAPQTASSASNLAQP